jgi:PAS domain S-box-containing protein
MPARSARRVQFSPATARALLEARQLRQIADLQNEVAALTRQVTSLNRDLLHAERERESFRSLYRDSPVGFLACDAEGRVAEASWRAAALLGGKREQVLGVALSWFFSHAEAQRWVAHLRHCRSAGKPQAIELTLRPYEQTGQERVIQFVTTTAPAKQELIYLNVMIDLTEARRNERALGETIVRLHMAAEAARFGTFEYDIGTGEMSWSQELRAIVGWSDPARAASLPAARGFIPPADLPPATKQVLKAFRPRGTGRYEEEHRLSLADGSERWVLARGRVFFEGKGRQRRAKRAVGIVLDITQRKQAEQALRDAHGLLERRVRQRTEQLHLAISDLRREVADRRRLEQEILKISDRERQRMGQDLHDGLGQQLAGLSMMQDLLQKRLEQQQLPESAAAARIATVIGETREELRRIARGLNPMDDEPLALVAGLDQFCRTWKDHGGACRFHCPEPVHVNEPAVATHLFRIAQEAVSNAHRHGRAKQIVVRLSKAKGQLILEVRDNGCGIPKDADNRNGLGLRIMRSRAESIGGRIEAQRLPRGGTTVRCVVPLPLST